jgi:hypothetical protein
MEMTVTAIRIGTNFSGDADRVETDVCFVVVDRNANGAADSNSEFFRFDQIKESAKGGLAQDVEREIGRVASMSLTDRSTQSKFGGVVTPMMQKR